MQANQELQRIKSLSAFNVQGAIARRNLNQYCREYRFADRSILRIYSDQTAIAQLGKVRQSARIRANVFGN